MALCTRVWNANDAAIIRPPGVREEAATWPRDVPHLTPEESHKCLKEPEGDKGGGGDDYSVLNFLQKFLSI